MLYESGMPVCLKCAKRRKSPEDDPAAIYAILVLQLEEATRLASSACTELAALGSDAPSGAPSPNRTQRIHKAANALNAAREKAVAAQNRLEDYLERGTVPEDLKRSG